MKFLLKNNVKQTIIDNITIQNLAVKEKFLYDKRNGLKSRKIDESLLFSIFPSKRGQN